MSESERQLGGILGSAINALKKHDESLVKKSSVTTWFQINWFKVGITCVECKISYLDDTGFSVVGHPVLGVIPWRVGGNDGYIAHDEDLDDYNITDVGKEQLAKFFDGEGPDRPICAAWGTSDTAYSQSQTAMGSQVSINSGSAAADGDGRFEVTVDFSDGSTGTLQEIGLFDATTDGNMWFRAVMDDLVITSTLRIRAQFTLLFSDQSENSESSVITTYGLNHFADWVINGTSAFGYTEWSDGTADVDVSNTSLDGSNKDRNAISASRREDLKVERVTLLETDEFNTYTMGKVGNFVSSTGDNLVTETKLPGQSKQDTFRVRNVDVFEIVDLYTSSEQQDEGFPYEFPIQFE